MVCSATSTAWAINGACTMLVSTTVCSAGSPDSPASPHRIRARPSTDRDESVSYVEALRELLPS
jgi:hypothetical protein